MLIHSAKKKKESRVLTVGDVATYVRSKNAGPFWMTIDIFCDTPARFAQLKNSKAIQKEVVARVYHVAAEKVKIFTIPHLHVIKISLPRPHPQGDTYERDMHFGQQYVQIFNLAI
jgi:Domain of unknown function (DUF4387)